MLKPSLPGAQASGKYAHIAAPSATLGFTGVYDPDPERRKPRLQTPAHLLSPALLDGGSINLDASMLGGGATSFVLSDDWPRAAFASSVSTPCGSTNRALAPSPALTSLGVGAEAPG